VAAHQPAVGWFCSAFRLSSDLGPELDLPITNTGGSVFFQDAPLIVNIFPGWVVISETDTDISVPSTPPVIHFVRFCPSKGQGSLALTLPAVGDLPVTFCRPVRIHARDPPFLGLPGGDGGDPRPVPQPAHTGDQPTLFPSETVSCLSLRMIQQFHSAGF